MAPLLQNRRQPIVWSVAGFDPSSGAGVTADLMTFATFGLFGCSAITTLTVQSTLGVTAAEPVSADLFRSTLERLEEDLPARGIKIGALGSAELARILADFLRDKRAAGRVFPVVFDPVLRSSSGRLLYPEGALDTVRQELLPVVDWLTPNWGELNLISGVAIDNVDAAVRAVQQVRQTWPHLGMVLTGGDQRPPVDWVFDQQGGSTPLPGEHIETTSTHGTGCAFSSALLSGLVQGREPVEAALSAKRFVEGALTYAPGHGSGRGPMELLWPLLQARAPDLLL